MPKKISLIILDGFGINNKVENNAIKLANSKNFNELFSKNYTKLEASENYVGLPDLQMGNSEIGHQTIGAGRVIKSSLVQINDLFKNKEFEKIKEFKQAVNHSKKYNSKIHIFTLFGSGGVHAYINHLSGIIELIDKNIKICLHLFSDGRDLPKDSFKSEFSEFLIFLENHKNVEITTISGRFYAMDRDNNWERIQKIYDKMTKKSKSKTSILEYIDNNYKNGVFDEFFLPENFTSNIVENNDSIIHLNFRSDRAIQLTKAFVEKIEALKQKNIKNLFFVSMTKYYKEYKHKVFIKENKIKNTLASVLNVNKLTQLHLAETEKFAHVTSFFNSSKKTYSLQKNILVSSKKVISYAQIPEMSAYEILDTYKKEYKNFDFCVVNFANGDMVGHTGDLEASIKAVKTLDEIIGELISISKENNVDLFISADHGNCETMFDENNEIVTSHTLNKVPLWHIKNGNFVELKQKHGSLADLAPTILYDFNIEIPKEINGKNLFL